MADPRNNLPRRTRIAAPRQFRAAAIGRAVLSRPKTFLAAAIGVLAIACGLVLVLLPSSPSRYVPPLRARPYSAYMACLLTDSQGISSAEAKPVWSGMQAASKATNQQINYLAIQGEETPANADTYLNTLALRGCNTIVTVGKLANQAVHDRATAYPHVQFTVVNPDTPLPVNATSTTAGNVQSTLKNLYQAWEKSA